MKQGIVTQIGSLPYDDVKRAVDYSLRHDIPFLPELPLLGDSMLDYIQDPGKLSCLEEFQKNKFKTVKIQCIGPATLVLSGRYSPDKAVQKAYEHISCLTQGLTAEETLLFLDEPALGAAKQENWNP